MHHLICILFAASIIASSSVIANEREHVIAVIVNRKENLAVLKFTSSQLQLIYWRKRLYWPLGRRIKPVNLHSDHPIRLKFSQIVLGSSPMKQIDYWNGLYFNGLSPPYSVNSEEAVLRYVSQTDGAIGYIGTCNIDVRVKPLAWIVNNEISLIEPITDYCNN